MNSGEPFCGTILLVDDEKDLREFLFMTLQIAGHAVLQADSAHQARDRYHRHADEIDLVITDIVMPGMSGDEFAAELLRENPSLKVIFISGNVDGAYDSKVPLVAGVNYLRKPFSTLELEEMIQRQCRK